MRKIFLLPLCISCVCGISACSTQSYEQEEIFIADDEVSAIDMTNNAGNRCGVNGISCNENALINYTKTEADYREYGERTRRDHLYTQAAAGNNLTASIRPTIEDDVVTVAPIAKPISKKMPVRNDGTFQNTTAADVGVRPQAYNSLPTISKDKVGITNNVRPNNLREQPISEYSPVANTPKYSKYSYEVVCGDNGCVKQEVSTSSQKETITDRISEFTEESFDISDYIEPESADEEITFANIGSEAERITDININEVQISDNTILTWEAEEGDNLRDLLTKWSAMSGWKLLWQTNRNYVLGASVMFKGKFADVSSALIRAFARARPAPIATYYKGNRVIVVETMENENAY